jgi:hypothetical protein
MIVLQEVGTAQTFKITPRSGTATTMTLQKEGTTLAPVSYNITLSGSGYYREITKIVTLEEGCSYALVVYNNSDVIYKGRVYCTNQTIEDYTINNDVYEQHAGTYILI